MRASGTRDGKTWTTSTSPSNDGIEFEKRASTASSSPTTVSRDSAMRIRMPVPERSSTVPEPISETRSGVRTLARGARSKATGMRSLVRRCE